MKKQLLALTFGIVGALVPAPFVVAAENQSALIAVSKVKEYLKQTGAVIKLKDLGATEVKKEVSEPVVEEMTVTEITA